MDANLISKTSETLKTGQTGGASKVLKNGDSALVRVISDKGGGRYEGSVSGVRVSFTSARPLAQGSSFVATVSVKGNTIVLIPKDGVEAARPGTYGSGVMTLEGTQVTSLLQELNLVPDSLSLLVLQAARQMEMKLEPSLLQKVRNLALRFGEKQKSAAEVLLLLAEKGINPTQEELLELLRFLEGDFLENSEGKKEGEPFINKVNRAEGSWFLFPFEIVPYSQQDVAQQSGAEKPLGTGSLRILYDHGSRIKLTNLFCNYGEILYYFSIGYEAGRAVSLKMNVQGAGVEKDDVFSHVKERFSVKFPGVEVLWAEKEDVEGAACAGEELRYFGGEA